MKRGLFLLLVGLIGGSAAFALDSPHLLKQVSSHVAGAKTVIVLRGEGIPSFTVYRLESPLQVVVELSGGRVATELSQAPMRLDTPLVSQAEVSELNEETGRTVRVVLTLKRLATYDVRAKGPDVVVTLMPEGKTAPGAIIDEPPTPKAPPIKNEAKPAVVVSGGKPNAAQAPLYKLPPGGQKPLFAGKDTAAKKTVPLAPPSKITGIDLEDQGDVVRLVVSATAPPKATLLAPTNTNGERILRLENTTIEPRLSRTYNASVPGPVTTVSAYANATEPGTVNITARLKIEVTPTMRVEGDKIFWEFPKARVANSFSPPQVAGHGLNTLPLQVGAPPPVAALPTTPPATTAAANQPVAPASASQTAATPSSANPRLLAQPKRQGARIDLDFKDVDINNMLRVFARVGGVNIVSTDDVKGTVTVSMQSVPWDYALDAILRAKGLGQVREGNLIRVAPRATLEKEMADEIARNKQLAELIPTVTRLIPLSYAEAIKIMPRVQDVLSPRGRVSVDERVNTLIISDIPANLDLAQQLARNLDTQTPQVLIEARIVEARTTLLRDLGIQWGGNFMASGTTGNPTGLVFPSSVGVAGGNQDQSTSGQGLQNGQAASPNYVVNLPAAVGSGSGGALGLTLGSLAGVGNINLRLSALENTGNIHIISAPKIMSLDNVESSIEQGIAIPITVTSALGPNTVFVDAKLSLTVKPHITNDGSVIMYVSITKNEPDFSNRGTLGAPSILKKQAKTQMLVKDGETTVIGGIYTRSTSTSYNKVPFLGDIPILGWLFKRRGDTDDRTELLIFITPRIVSSAAAKP